MEAAGELLTWDLTVGVYPGQVVAFPEAHCRGLGSPARKLAIDCLRGGGDAVGFS